MIELSREVIGFHGTSRAALPHLLARDIRPSDQHFEWLGTGFYLWQDSPWRARNPRWQAEVRDADFEFVLHCIANEQPLPVNTDRGNHARDAATINWYCARAAEAGHPVRSVRAIFEEGEPIFEASKIRSLSHVQVAVRDLTAILDIEEASP